MNWFLRLTGLDEETPESVREQLFLECGFLKSRANGSSWCWGRLGTPSLAELREAATGCTVAGGPSSLCEVVADVQSLYADPANAGALFQVASQFNLLEMVSPRVSPEEGVGIYEYDRTQGPASAIAAGAGTIYRNYFAPVGGGAGQSADRQIDCLADLGEALGNGDGRLWSMRNGYALATREGLSEISQRLAALDETERDVLRGRLRIGLQSATEVTLPGCGHLVSQVYGSALPVAYSEHGAEHWEGFARLVLEASYEATMLAGLLNAAETGVRQVFLTLIGGGAFGNRTGWILDAIHRALQLHRDAGLEVAIVSYGSRNPDLAGLLDDAPPQSDSREAKAT